MERRLNKKAETYITAFKDSIREKATQLGMTKNDQVNQLLQYIYDHDRLSFNKEDFQKRKRVKNFVPVFDRCCAKRASDEQCTRRKKDGCEFCGTHLKGTPHGVVDESNEPKNNTQKVDVWAQDIQGIVYYIDKNMNRKTKKIKKPSNNPEKAAIIIFLLESINIPIPSFSFAVMDG